MLHLTNTYEPPAFPSSSSAAAAAPSSSSAASPFVFSLKRGWCQSSTVLGSVLLQEGSSVASAVVHILRPNTGRNVNFDRAVLECSVSRASHVVSSLGSSKSAQEEEETLCHVHSKAVEAALLPAVLLETYPKSVISIHVKILQSSEHDTAAAISAASLALLDASVEMRDIVLGVMLQNDDAALGPVFRCVLATLSALQQVSFMDFTGEVDPVALSQLVAACKAQCGVLRASVLDAFRPGA